MANFIEVIIKGVVSPEFQQALDKAAQSVEGMGNKVGIAVENVNKRFEGMNKGLTALGQGMQTVGVGMTAAITVPLTALGYGAFKAAAQIETLTVSFAPLLGSMAAAKTRMEELRNFANATPFTLPEVAQASRMLEVLTKGALSTGKALTMVGDVASGTGQNFNDVAMWVGRLYDGLKSGRPVGEAMARLQEMGAVSGDARNKIEAMANSGADFSQVWAVATGEFGRYAGGMEMQSQTLAGKWSTLQDAGTTALSKLGASFEGFAKTMIDAATWVLDKLGALADWFASMPGWIKGTVAAVALFVAALGPVIAAVGTVLTMLPALMAGWTAFAALLPAVATGLTGVATATMALLGPIALVVAAIAVWVIAIKRISDAWNEEKRMAEEATRIEAETARKVAEIHKKAAEERAQKELQKNQLLEQIASKTTAGKIAALKKEHEQNLALVGNDAAARLVVERDYQEKLAALRKSPKAGGDAKAKADAARREAEEVRDIRNTVELQGMAESAERDRRALQQKFDIDIAKTKEGSEKRKALEEKYYSDLAIIEKKWLDKSLAESEAAKKEEIARRKELEKKQLDDANAVQAQAREAFEKIKTTTFTGAWYAEVEQRTKAIGTGFQQVARTIGSITDAATNSLANGLTGVITRTKSLRAAMADVGREILQSVVGGIIKAGLQWVATEAMKLTMSQTMAATSLAVTAPIAAAQSALWTGPATLSAIATMGASSAQAPASIAAAMALVKGIGSFDVGTPRVPRDMLAMVHQGETIVPANFAEGIRRGEMTLGGGGGGSHGASLVLDSDIMSVIARNGSALVKVTKDQTRKFS